MGGASARSELNPRLSSHYLIGNVKEERGGDKFEEFLGGKIFRAW